MYLKSIEISKNDILKNTGSGIHLSNIRGESNDKNRIMIRNNQITEIYNGYGIYLEHVSATLEHNEIRKN